MCTYKCAHLHTRITITQFKFPKKGLFLFLVSCVFGITFTVTNGCLCLSIWWHISCLAFNDTDIKLLNPFSHLEIYYSHLENMTFSPYVYKWSYTETD